MARWMTFSSSRTFPGQSVLHERIERRARQFGPGPVVVGGVFRQEKVDERWDLLAPLPQRRHVDADDVQTEEQILPELPGGHRIFEVPIGRGDNPHVDLDISVTAEPGELAILQDMQQLGLQRGRHLADFVQEDGAVVGELELAWLCLQGAAEGAALEPEHLRLEQVAR